MSGELQREVLLAVVMDASTKAGGVAAVGNRTGEKGRRGVTCSLSSHNKPTSNPDLIYSFDFELSRSALSL